MNTTFMSVPEITTRRGTPLGGDERGGTRLHGWGDPAGRRGIWAVSYTHLPRPPRPAGQGAPRPGGASRQGGRPGGFRGAQPAEPETFEDRLKHFMQASDSKLSEMRYLEKKSSRRGGRK